MTRRAALNQQIAELAFCEFMVTMSQDEWIELMQTPVDEINAVLAGNARLAEIIRLIASEADEVEERIIDHALAVTPGALGVQ